MGAPLESARPRRYRAGMHRVRHIAVCMILAGSLLGVGAVPCPAAPAEVSDATCLRAEAQAAEAAAQAADEALLAAERALPEARRAWDAAAAEAVRVTRAARDEAERRGRPLPVLRPPKDLAALLGQLKAAEDKARKVEVRTCAEQIAAARAKGFPPEVPCRQRTVTNIEDPFDEDTRPPVVQPDVAGIVFQPVPGESRARRAARESAKRAAAALVAAGAAVDRRRTEARTARNAARKAVDAADWADVELVTRSAPPGEAVHAIEAYLSSHPGATKAVPRARLRELGALPDLRPLAVVFANAADAPGPAAPPSASIANTPVGERPSVDDPQAPDHLDALAREALAWTAVAFTRSGPSREPALRHALALVARYDGARPLHPAAADVLDARIRLESALGNSQRAIRFTDRLVREFPQSAHARGRLFEALQALLAAGEDAPAAELAHQALSRRVVEAPLDRARALLVLGYARWSVSGRSETVRQDLEAAGHRAVAASQRRRRPSRSRRWPGRASRGWRRCGEGARTCIS